MKTKIFILSVFLLGLASTAQAGGYAPMPSKNCLRSPVCMADYDAQVQADTEAERKAETSWNVTPIALKPKTVEVVEPKRCAEKPGGWSEIEFYERNTWFFQTWGRLMTVEERDAFRCGWPIR